MKEGYNLVVSYAHEGEASTEITKNWIDHFCRYLQIFVNRLSPFDLKVVKSEEVEGRSTNSLLIPVITPAYLNSEKCKSEINEYSQSGAAIYYVQRLPVNRNGLPPVLRQQLSYDFFERSEDAENNLIIYDPAANHRNYWLKLIDLAYDIIQDIAYSEHKRSVQEGKFVYLAETSFDQQSNRDILKRELQRFGYSILPDHPLPEDSLSLEEAIRTYLEKSTLAIHMVGAHYGNTITGTEQSLIAFQNKVAGQFTEELFRKEGRMLKRYLWSPPNLRPADEKQMLYLEQLKEEVDKSTNAEIIQVPLENLKSIVEKQLEEKRQQSRKEMVAIKKNGDASAIYLVYDQEDATDLSGLKTQLESEKFHVLIPDFEGDQINMLNTHRSKLVESDAVLIYANRSNEFWLNSKINDLIKSPGFGRSKPFLAKAICAPNHQLDIFGVNGYNDLINLKNLNAESINSFLGKLK